MKKGTVKKALGLSKFSGELKGLDAAIVKATSYKHALPKEKHIRTIFHSLSPSKPRSEVIYCIEGLSKRFSHTHNWSVAMKSLLVLHRAIRELDSSIFEELLNYRDAKGYIIDFTHFHGKSVPSDFSIWIRHYALYIEERIQCFNVINYDAATNSSKYSEKLDNKILLEQLPALQNLLSRLLDCRPGGLTTHNRLVQYATSIVAGESVKLYVAITVRVVELLDKFFEMENNDARSSLRIYKKSGNQAERLSEFFETCKRLEFGRGRKFINIKMPPASFIATMEEYIKEAPSPLMLENNMDHNSERLIKNNNASSTGGSLTINDAIIDKSSNASAENNTVVPQPAELMGLYDLLTGASEFEEKSLEMPYIPSENDENKTNPDLGWEVALFTELENHNGDITTETKNNKEKGCGMEFWKHDNVHDDEMNANTQQSVTTFSSQVRFNPFDLEASHDEQINRVLASPNSQNELSSVPNMSSPIPYQIGDMPYQHLVQQQNELSIAPRKTTNPFDDTNMLPSTVPTHPTQTT
ncbi:Phosphoinositide-binding clathrin adaptor [Vigna unguiculata]|uniref:Phosphoinositide-binding clathrin adaptor n=1 Tax=Vigna unguiculata TaxID=3917 RepID=A0A4D6NK51_VIGUN|nr:Phosphoinositide-binding clathrin adaptor [Vigna unguiculata]